MTYTLNLAKRLATAHDTIMIVLLLTLAACSQDGDLKEGFAPPDPPPLTGVTVSPDPAVIGVGQTQIFTALGNMSDGSTSPVAVSWSATGGSITGGGTYVAGTTPGSFRVIAVETSGLADTAAITVQSSGGFGQPDLLNNASFESGWDGFQNTTGGSPSGISGATIVRSTEQSLDGSWSAKSTLPPGQTANLFSYSFGARDHVFVRVYYYATTHPTDNHKWIRFQRPGFSGGHGLYTWTPGGAPSWQFPNSGGVHNWFDALGPTVFNTWHYWEIEYDMANGRIRFWHDGVATLPTPNSTNGSGGTDFIQNGWIHSGGGAVQQQGILVFDDTVNGANSNNAVYYYDRIAISTQRIGP